MLQARRCKLCEKPVKGRSDKKFCNDYCRNSYNNRARADSSHCVRIINNALLKNRRVLLGLLEEGSGQAKADCETLLERGFQFKYSTHAHTNQRGELYLFCYDHGYCVLEDGQCLIVSGVIL
jgi:hypothetical protein